MAKKQLQAQANPDEGQVEGSNTGSPDAGQTPGEGGEAGGSEGGSTDTEGGATDAGTPAGDPPAEGKAKELSTNPATQGLRTLRARAAEKYDNSTKGRPHIGDELGSALVAAKPTDIVVAATKVFNEPNKYAHLNIGQQSMSYRNRMRAAIKKGTFKVEDVVAALPVATPAAASNDAGQAAA